MSAINSSPSSSRTVDSSQASLSTGPAQPAPLSVRQREKQRDMSESALCATCRQHGGPMVVEETAPAAGLSDRSVPSRPEPMPPIWESTNPIVDSLLCNGFPWRWLGVLSTAMGVSTGLGLVHFPTTSLFAAGIDAIPRLPLAHMASRLPIAPHLLWGAALVWATGASHSLAEGMAAGENEAARLVRPWGLDAMARGMRAGTCAAYAVHALSGARSLAPLPVAVPLALSAIVGMETTPTRLGMSRSKTGMGLDLAACVTGAALLVASLAAPAALSPPLVQWGLYSIALYFQFWVSRSARAEGEFDSDSVAALPRSEDAIGKRRRAMRTGQTVVECTVGMALLVGLGWQRRASLDVAKVGARWATAAMGGVSLWLGLDSLVARAPQQPANLSHRE